MNLGLNFSTVQIICLVCRRCGSFARQLLTNFAELDVTIFWNVKNAFVKVKNFQSFFVETVAMVQRKKIKIGLRFALGQ